MDKDGFAQVTLVKLQEGDASTSSVPNLTTCNETGKLMLKKTNKLARHDSDNKSIA